MVQPYMCMGQRLPPALPGLNFFCLWCKPITKGLLNSMSVCENIFTEYV